MLQKKENKKNETAMKRAYMNMPKAEADLARKRIIEQCGVNYTIFYNWVNGITPVPKLCRCIISCEFKKNEFDLFPKEE